MKLSVMTRFMLAMGAGIAPLSMAHAACSAPAELTLSFAQASARLAQCNREVLLARSAVGAAEADVRTADRGQNPTLTLGTGYINPQAGIGSGSPWQKQVDLQARIDQPVERGNKRGLRVAATTSALRAVQWNAVDMLRQQQLGLANAWIEVWAAQERMKVLADLRALYQRAHEAASKRLGAGDIAANDLVRISVDTQRSENDLQQVLAERTRAQYALATILALEADARELKASDTWLPLAAAPSSTMQADLASARRPDLQAARAQRDSARAARELALSQRTRDINVGVQLEHYPAPAGIGNSVSISVSMPLFVRHKNEGEIARAEADYTTALLALNKAEQQAAGDQGRLEAERQAAQARARRLKDQVLPLVEKMAANADLAYKKGAAGVFDLLDSLKQLRQTQLDLVAAQADYEKADAAAWSAALDFTAAQDVTPGSYNIPPAN